MGYIVKTPSHTFSIDLIHKHIDKFAKCLDFNLITHKHKDHGSPNEFQAFAAAGENIRDSKYEVNGKDLIEVLFDNYYNADKNILEYTKGVENTYSTNQTIVSLMAYKVYRDTQKAVNIYG